MKMMKHLSSGSLVGWDSKARRIIAVTEFDVGVPVTIYGPDGSRDGAKLAPGESFIWAAVDQLPYEESVDWPNGPAYVLLGECPKCGDTIDTLEDYICTKCRFG